MRGAAVIGALLLAKPLPDPIPLTIQYPINNDGLTAASASRCGSAHSDRPHNRPPAPATPS
jgi:hypothetical protein